MIFNSKTIFPAAIAAVAFSVAAPSFASTISGAEILREWNLVVLGNLQSTSEVEGRTFVGGDLSGNSSNYNIHTGTAPSTNGQPGLTVVGNVTGGHKNLNNGSGAIVGGNVESGFNLNGATQTVQVGGSLQNTNINQNNVTANLGTSNPQFVQDLKQQGSHIATSTKSLSHEFTTLSPTSNLLITGNRGTFNAVPGDNNVAVFNISAADLNNIGEIQFNLNGADTVIVNVSGKAITLDDNFLGGTNNLGERVIWNFPEADSLNLSTAWGGSVLAPYAAAQTSNYIQGSAVFGSLKQDGEMHIGTYVGGYTPPPPSSTSSGGTTTSSGGTQVPEPGALGLLAAGAAALLLLRRRRKAS